MTVLYDAIENTVANTIKATYTVRTAQDAKVGRDTVEYTTAFLCSDRQAVFSVALYKTGYNCGICLYCIISYVIQFHIVSGLKGFSSF